MPEWEYRKIHLSDIPVRSVEIDLLNEAGKDGWELVGIASNNVAYLKRPIEKAAPVQDDHAPARSTRRKTASAAK